jgi:hypothetical protein
MAKFGCNYETLYAYGLICWIYCLCAPCAHALMCCFPPGAILIQKKLKPDKWSLFNFTGGNNQRADPSNNGHKTLFGEKSWEKVVLISVVLTFFGVIPGILFAFFSVYRHFFAFLVSAQMCPSCFGSCCSRVCCFDLVDL